MTYTLIDAVQRAADNPDTWEDCDRNAVEGQHVKLGFVSPTPLTSPFHPDHTINTERMWVKVITVKGDTLIGVLDNKPAAFPKNVLKLGDTVVFERKNICAMMPAPEPETVH